MLYMLLLMLHFNILLVGTSAILALLEILISAGLPVKIMFIDSIYCNWRGQTTAHMSVIVNTWFIFYAISDANPCNEYADLWIQSIKGSEVCVTI